MTLVDEIFYPNGALKPTAKDRRPPLGTYMKWRQRVKLIALKAEFYGVISGLGERQQNGGLVRLLGGDE